jgi:hypothetical protein
MFAETITTEPSLAQAVWDHSRLFTEPPAGLLAAITWESGGDDVTAVMVWESPAARGAFAAERMVPLFEAGILGEEHGPPRAGHAPAGLSGRSPRGQQELTVNAPMVRRGATRSGAAITVTSGARVSGPSST